MFSNEHLAHLISAYGYWTVGGMIFLEGIGIPLPGETALILAAIYAGKTHGLRIELLIALAVISTIIGSSIGWWIGRKAGYPLICRFGRSVGLTTGKIKVGQYLFVRHGGKIVFFSRFIVGLHSLNALLAGSNIMSWARFQVFNVTGAAVWAMVVGVLAYFLSEKVAAFAGPVEAGIGVVAAILVVAAVIYARRHEARLEAAAEQALPGPLKDGASH